MGADSDFAVLVPRRAGALRVVAPAGLAAGPGFFLVAVVIPEI
jgi:hypothetical protein